MFQMAFTSVIEAGGQVTDGVGFQAAVSIIKVTIDVIVFSVANLIPSPFTSTLMIFTMDKSSFMAGAL